MALMCVAKLTSRVKGHHVYNHRYTVGEELVCEMEPTNAHSNNAIAVKKNENVVGHVPEALAAKLHPLMKNWKVHRITCVITGQERRAPEGTWVLGGGIELPCIYYLYGPKTQRKYVRDTFKEHL